MSLSALTRFVRQRTTSEKCELCGVPLGEEHPHLVEPAERKILCACAACALLFDAPGGKYRRVPRDVRMLSGFMLTDAQWDRFEIPIGAAFFFESSPAGRIVAFYPSPAGAVESLLPLDAWKELAQENPMLRTFEPDVEALLVNRIAGAREYFRAPIDVCYRLAGLLRLHWKSFSGGTEVWKALEAFFAELRLRGRV